MKRARELEASMELESDTTPERQSAAAPAFALFADEGSRATSGRGLIFERLLWTIAAACALWITFAATDRVVFQSGHEREFSPAILPASSLEAGSEPEAVPRLFVARLEIPSIGLSRLVVDGVDDRTLRRAIGRIPSSARPGEAGDVALAGHRDTDFRELGRVGRGERMQLRTAYGEFEYVVESIRIVEPHRVDVLDPADHATLTLVTCYPFRYLGAAPLRYVVRAREVSRPEPHREAFGDRMAGA